MRTRLAQLIAKEEGFGRAGVLPTVRHNPGDLRHSPHSSHSGIGNDDIGIIDTDEHGWEDLERQLLLYAARGYTLEKAIYAWAPESDGNSPMRYLHDVLAGFGGRFTPESSLVDVLKVPGITATSPQSI